MNLNVLLKNTSRSLYLSVKMLPCSMRPAFGLAYLLCRYVDTIADTDLLPIEKRLDWVQQFPTIVRRQDHALQAALVRDLTGTSENPYEAQLIAHLSDCLTALNQIPAEQKPFIYDVVQAVCNGMCIDLTVFPNQKKAGPVALKTIADLTHYCRLMGGKPGLFWSQLIYHTHKIKISETDFYALGQHIGDALQIVNVLRDLPKDLRFGRCYFPMEQLEQQGISAASLLQREREADFAPIKQYWIRWGKENLQHAFAYFSALPKKAWRTRAAVAWPILWTADTFYKLAVSQDLLNPAKRVKISRWVIYGTMLITPVVLLSNRFFDKWLSYKLKKLT